jgi:hypothetical protein
MIRPYLNLFESMWKLALEDELKRQKARLFCDLVSKVCPATQNFEQIKNFNMAIAKFPTYRNLLESAEMHFDECKGKLTRAVKEKIYREAQAWPKNIGKNKEYEKAYVQLLYSIISKFEEVSA